MTELILYILERACPVRKCNVIKNSSEVIKIFIFVQAQRFGYSWIFLQESFPDKWNMHEPKYTLQIIVLFLNWKQPF